MMFVHKKRTTLYLMIAVTLLALSMRVAFFMINIKQFGLYGDALNYHIMAKQLVQSGIFGYSIEGVPSKVSNAYVTPGFPLIFSCVVYFVKNHYLQINAMRLLQVIAGALTPLAAFLFVKNLLKRNDAAVLTAFFVAIYSSYVESPVRILTEVFALFTVMVYFYLITVGIRKQKNYLIFLSGIMFAVHILIRPAMLPLFPLPFIYIFFHKNDYKYRIQKSEVVKFFIIAVLGFTITMMPWWIRNYMTLNKIVLTATQSGHPMLAGSYPYKISSLDLFKDYYKHHAQNDTSHMATFAKKRIINGFRTQPLLFLKWYTIGKIQYIFKQPWLYGNLNSKVFDVLFHYILIFGGLSAVIINSIKERIHRFITIYFLIFLAIHLLFIPITRYNYQFMFFFMLELAVLIADLASFFRSRFSINAAG
jgi:4-amino-4-deoxy-L-arabinose transferase-like glycosyltransferase